MTQLSPLQCKINMACDIFEFRVHVRNENMATSKQEIKFKNAPAKYTSKVWKHFGFSLTDDNKAVCKLCFAEVKYSGGTTNLSVHLKRHHGIDMSDKVLGKGTHTHFNHL